MVQGFHIVAQYQLCRRLVNHSALPPGVDLRLDDGLEEVFLIRACGQIEGLPGDLVSLLPLGAPAQGVTTRGLKYPLNGETLQMQRTRGISNVLLQPQAVVTLTAGCLVCVHRRQLRKK